MSLHSKYKEKMTEVWIAVRNIIKYRVGSEVSNAGMSSLVFKFRWVMFYILHIEIAQKYGTVEIRDFHF